MKKEFVCIVCPNSCHLTVEEKDGELKVSGNRCIGVRPTENRSLFPP